MRPFQVSATCVVSSCIERATIEGEHSVLQVTRPQSHQPEGRNEPQPTWPSGYCPASNLGAARWDIIALIFGRVT